MVTDLAGHKGPPLVLVVAQHYAFCQVVVLLVIFFRAGGPCQESLRYFNFKRGRGGSRAFAKARVGS
jgi:hypothetical protein